MQYHQLMLENQTIFTKMVFEKLESDNLTVGQPKVLEYLYTHNGAVQKDIAQACMIEPATLTSLLSRLEKNGLIKRASNGTDKRYLCVYLTEIGEQCGANVIKALEELEKITLENFSDDEKEQFIGLLSKANKNLVELRVKNKSEK